MADSLPDFLIIGAAKSGTTTLYADLAANPQIFFPATKEPADLSRDDVLTPRGRARYAKLFASARPGQLLAEASTRYTSRPMFEGVAERARQLLGPSLKLIYLVRDPYERMLSEHRYAAQQGKVPGELASALRQAPRLIEHSRYGFQIAPWLDHFDRDRLEIVSFERYVAAREPTVRALFAFLGATAPSDYRLPAAQNSSNDVIVGRGILRHIVGLQGYRRTIRRIVPHALRERAKAVLGKKLDVVIDQRLPAALERELIDRLRPEVDEIHRVAGWNEPMWQRFA